jgi:TonB family protein
MKAAVHQEENRSAAALGTFLFHAALLAVMFLYRFSHSEVPPEAQAIVLNLGGGGDNAALGSPDEGDGNDPAPPGQQLDDPSSTQPVDNPDPSPAKPSSPPPAKTPPPATTDKVEVPKNTPTSSDSDAASVQKAQEEKRKQQQEQDRIRKQQDDQRIAAETERRRQQEEADRRKREQEERDRKKGQFGSAFGKPGATGTGQGNTGKPGNQGVPGGTGDNPFGKSPGDGGGTGGGSGTGTGSSVGGGLGGRRVVSRAKPAYNSDKSGTVRVAVCVDGEGRVTSARSQQVGSTTTAGELRSAAESAARQWKFAADNAAGEQCGWIDFNFRKQ